jgi:hypothetical protein
MSKNKKKLGYKQYEAVLSEHDYKLEILARKYNELQTYFLGFIEFCGKSIEFHEWMNAQIKKSQEEVKAKEQSKEKEGTLHEEV